jgi:lipoyl-dependent peroxiredoxin
MKTLYEATSVAIGGRKGDVTTEGGPLDLVLSIPASTGAGGEARTNPEQLFGCAYSACFGGTVEFLAKNKGITLPDDFSVTAIIGYCKDEEGTFLEATLDCYLPGIAIKTGEDLLNEAHELCVFSKATRDNITVTLNLLLEE